MQWHTSCVSLNFIHIGNKFLRCSRDNMQTRLNNAGVNTPFNTPQQNLKQSRPTVDLNI